MDARHFDNLLRALTAASARRGVLSILTGSLVAGSLASLLGTFEGDAKKRKKKKKKCKKRQKKCDGKCIPSDECCTDTDCEAGERCQNGACSAACEPSCMDRQCGNDGCGRPCGSCTGNDTCQDGQCVCQPGCSGKSCGSDGCGGSCGTCIAGAETCQEQQCVCSTPGKLGPGEICSSAADCCSYSGEEICSRGTGFCETFLPVCRSGLGGKCGGNCDCRGDLECRDGRCQCPPGRPYLDDGICCLQGDSPCGGVRCCGPFESCFCPPGGTCRCL